MDEVSYMVMDDDKYQEMQDVLANSGYESDENAFCCFLEEDQYVMLREGFVNSVSQDELCAVIAHEMAHLEGIMDEEEADMWAIENLEHDNQKQVLIDMWEERHGHKYGEELW